MNGERAKSQVEELDHFLNVLAAGSKLWVSLDDPVPKIVGATSRIDYTARDGSFFHWDTVGGGAFNYRGSSRLGDGTPISVQGTVTDPGVLDQIARLGEQRQRRQNCGKCLICGLALGPWDRITRRTFHRDCL